jgi:3-deoxy-7-phosphoheptulonate synthase
VAGALELLGGAGLPRRVMIDCSHDNSGKDPMRQPQVAAEVGAQIADGERAIAGVMVESFLVAGRQDLVPGGELRYGQSITDGCIDWETTAQLLERLAVSVRDRRAARAQAT